MNVFISGDEIVFAIYSPPNTNHTACRRTCLSLAMNVHFVLGANTFGIGDEHNYAEDERFSAKDKRVENAPSSLSHAQT